MKVSERIYQSIEEIWKSYYEHPFVVGIADGSLDLDKFRFYMIQDYMYLLDYSKVFALGILKAHSEKDMRMFADLVHGTLNNEMSTHKTYMELLNISSEEITHAKASLTTESYTKYMLAVGHTNGIAEIVAAVLACSWSYLCIGQYIVKHYPDSVEHEFYGSWVTAYSSKAYEESNDILITLIDELTIHYTEAQLEYLIQVIVNCSRYEYQFWDMAWNMEM